MRILIKILLTFGIFIISGILFALFDEAGAGSIGVIRLIPAGVMLFGIIGVWRHKQKKQSNTDKTDLDKTL